MEESSLNVTLGIGEVIKEIKDTKTIEEADKTSALIVRAIHAALNPLEKWVLQKESEPLPAKASRFDVLLKQPKVCTLKFIFSLYFLTYLKVIRVTLLL